MKKRERLERIRVKRQKEERREAGGGDENERKKANEWRRMKEKK